MFGLKKNIKKKNLKKMEEKKGKEINIKIFYCFYENFKGKKKVRNLFYIFLFSHFNQI